MPTLHLGAILKGQNLWFGADAPAQMTLWADKDKTFSLQMTLYLDKDFAQIWP